MEIQWPLVLFSVFAGAGGVTLAFTGVAELTKKAQSTRYIATIVALIFAVVGGVFSVLHLAQPANIMAAATNIFSFSAISMELICIGLVLIIGIVYLLLLRIEAYTAAKVFAVLGILAGLFLAFETGNGYRMESQGNWNTITLSLGYLGTDLAAGSLVYMAVCAFRKVDIDDIKFFGLLSAICAVVSLITVFAYNIAIGFIANPVIFWIGCVIAAGIIPLVISLLCWRGRATNAVVLTVGAVIALAGAACFRIIMWLLGTGWLDLFSVAADHMFM